jgi:NitT/TauT family transport system permease protein
MFSKIQFPFALPEIFSGLKVGIALAVVGAIVAEFVAARSGLGYVLIVATSQLNTALIFADLLVLGLTGVVLFAAIDLLERLVVPWHVASGRPVVSA